MKGVVILCVSLVDVGDDASVIEAKFWPGDNTKTGSSPMRFRNVTSNLVQSLDSIWKFIFEMSSSIQSINQALWNGTEILVAYSNGRYLH